MAYTPPTGAGNVTSGTGTTGTTLTTNKPANLVDGDLLLLVGYKQTNGTYTTPSGFTLIYKAAAASTRGFAVYAKPIVTVSGEPSTYSIVTSEASTRWGIAAFRLPGMASTYLDAAPSSDVYYSSTVSSWVDPSVTAVAANTLALAFNFSNNSSAIYQTFTSSGWANLVNLQITSGASTSVVDVQYKEFTSAGSIGATTFAGSPAAASGGGFQLTLALAPTGTDYVKTPADSAGGTDAIALTRGPNPADNAGGTDSSAFVAGVVRTQSDSAGGADTASKQADAILSAADTAGATDSATPVLTSPGTISNNAEGGAAAGGNGTAATTVNTGGGSGTALFAVSNLTFSTASPQYGAYCYHGAGTTGVLEFGQLRLITSYTSYSVHVNFRYNGTPSAEGIWFNPMDDTNATLARVHITAANQLKVVNALGTVTWTSGTAVIPYTMVPGTDYTLQINSTVNSTTGTFNVRLKPKASATVLGSATMVGNTGATSFQRFAWGKFTSGVVVAGGHDTDEIIVVGGSTAFIEDPVTTVNLTPSDAAGATDSATPAHDVPQSFADDAGASDNVASPLDLVRVAADAASVSDVAALVREFVVDEFASATDTDGPQELAWEDVYDDPAAMSDVFTQSASISVADAGAASDVADDSLDSIRAASDAATGADSAADVLDTLRSAADAASASESTASVTGFARSVADPAAGSDVTTPALDALRASADAAGLTDAAQSVEDFPRVPVDSVDATDAASTVAASTRATGDGAAASDFVDVQLQSSTGQTLNDTGLGSDLVDWTMDRIVTVDDFLNAIDAAQREAVVGLNAADSAAGTDSTLTSWGYARLVADLAGAPDDASTGDRNYVSSKDEPVGAVDRVSVEHGPMPADLGAAGDILLLEREAATDELLSAEDAVDVTSDTDYSAADQAGARDTATARIIPLYGAVESRSIHATLSDDSHLVALLRS